MPGDEIFWKKALKLEMRGGAECPHPAAGVKTDKVQPTRGSPGRTRPTINKRVRPSDGSELRNQGEGSVFGRHLVQILHRKRRHTVFNRCPYLLDFVGFHG